MFPSEKGRSPVNILYSTNKKAVPYLLTSLRSLSKNGGDAEYNVFILHSELTEEKQAAIACAVAENIRLTFVVVPTDIFLRFPTTKRYPTEIYYRLAAPLLLPKELDRILYLDTDTVVINSLKTLYDLPLGDDYLAASTNARELLTTFNRLRLGVKKKNPYVNTGVLLMNLPALRDAIDLDRIAQWTRKKRAVMWLPDQDIVFALYGDKIRLIDGMVYNISDRAIRLWNVGKRRGRIDLEWVKKNSAIVHYLGRNKPWKKKYRGILGVFYRELCGE